tara:strand:- start:163 stop:405 length:243 start_codon:yes stop_codon:yes gene_type:complete
MAAVKCVIIKLELASDTERTVIMKRALGPGNALTLARSVEALVPVNSLTELRTLRALYGDADFTEKVDSTGFDETTVRAK